MNEACGPNSTTGFKTCQPPFRCGLLKDQNKYQCLCDKCNHNYTSLSKNAATVSVVVFIALIKLDNQCGGVSYKGNTECEPWFKCVFKTPHFSICKCPDESSWCPGAPGYPTTTAPPSKIYSDDSY